MSKAHHTSKDLKKKPLLTPKEKKTAKQVKKHNHDVHPLLRLLPLIERSCLLDIERSFR
jgi:hypothetical protein